MNRTSSRPLSIWIAGEPAPEAARIGGSFAHMIQTTTGAAWQGPWAVLDCVAKHAVLPAPTEIRGVIVTGSPARIADQTPWMRRVQQALRVLVAQQVPLLGICFGHQLLGVALGGRSGPNPAGREIGTRSLSVHAADDDLLRELPSGCKVQMTHQDTVLELPAGAAPLASTALDRYAAIRFAPTAWGVQFHPEMDREIMCAYIRARATKLTAEGFDSASLLAECEETPEAAAILTRFARLCSQPSANA